MKQDNFLKEVEQYSEYKWRKKKAAVEKVDCGQGMKLKDRIIEADFIEDVDVPNKKPIQSLNDDEKILSDLVIFLFNN